ncbi:MAG: hypothetical protein KatS3mg110_2847 [Pirellulaceae bacterium]|nr:MAG: hypothetical protein KatS3mg110_2847 [Pirellulaceae bacterium]
MAPIQPNVGLITGIPIQETVSRLMQIAARPRDLLISRNKSLQEQQVALNSLTALVVAIQLAAKNLAKASLFTNRAVTSSAPTILSATVNGTPSPGTYQFTPIRTAQTSSWISGGFVSRDQPLAAGRLVVGIATHVNNSLPLDQLNGGLGVQRGKIRITDRSGTSEVIDLSLAYDVQDVLDAINNATQIRVRAHVQGDRFVLEDLTGQTTSNLRVENVAGGLTADDLGLSGIDVAASSATGSDIVRLGPQTLLASLNDANGIDYRNGVAELKVSFRDGSNPLLIDFGDFSRPEGFARATTSAANGVNAQLTVTAKTKGAAYDGVRIRFIDSGTVTAGNETVSYDPNQKLLTFDIDAGASTAAGVVAALNNNATVSSLFSITAGGDGSGIVSLNDTATLTGGAAIPAVTNPTVGDLLRVLNEADPDRLEARIAADGDRLELIDKTSGAGLFKVESVSGGTAAETLGVAGQSAAGTITGRRLLGSLQSSLLASLHGGKGVGQLGLLRIVNRQGVETLVDLSASETLDDVIAAINAAGAGVTASVNRARNGLELRDESGGGGALIVQSADATQTAEQLGIEANTASPTVNGLALDRQIVSRNTLLETYRFGQPVRSGSFTITDATGKTAAVNLALLQPKTVGELLDIINGLGLSLVARINDRGDGIALEDTSGGSGTITVQDVGTSTAAADLRIAGQSTAQNINGQTVQILDGTATLSIEIASGDTPADLVERINASNGPVEASLVQQSGATPYRLLLSSRRPGTAGLLQVDDRDSPFALVENVRGQDALLGVGSGTGQLLLSSPTNSFSQPVQGLDVSIASASPTPVTVTVEASYKSFLANVKLFVDKYNETINKLREYTKFDAETNTTGILFGTTEAIRVNSALGRFISGEVRGAGTLRTFAQVGISVKDDGTLEYDESKLKQLLAEDPAAVEKFFTTPELGVAARLDALIENLAGAGNSVLINRNHAIQRRIEQNNERIDFWNKRLEKQQQILLAQFFRLENVVARMQATLDALSRLQPVPPLTSTQRG